MHPEVKRSIDDIKIHQSYFIKSASKIAAYLISIGKTAEAGEIMVRAKVHDEYKLSEDSLEARSKVWDNYASMKDANVHLPPEAIAIIAELDYKDHTYYPEHWKDDISQMPEMDIIEMVCDWHARSTQFGTDFIEFVKTRQQNRFNFPEDMFQKILGYCEILSL